MGIRTEIKADADKCKHCGRLLHQYYAGKRVRQALREWDDDIWIATMVDVRCAYCGGMTSIFYIADALPQRAEPGQGKLFRCAPTLRRQ
jgi:ribosomal protein S27E